MISGQMNWFQNHERQDRDGRNDDLHKGTIIENKIRV
jgi:hypothetical protein